MIKMKESGIAWIGEIPNNWSIQRVKHAFTRKNEKAMLKSPTVLSLARSGVKVRDISNNEGQIAESYYNYNPVENGDLLLNPMDLYSGANCSISKVNGVISPAYINLKNKNGYNSRFYDYYFKMQYWMMAFFAHGKGVSFDNRWTLSVETLMNYPIVTPDYDEQCKRADYLDEKCAKIDSIIKKQQAVIEKLKEYKLSIITEAVTKGIVSNCNMKDCDIEWIGKMPAHWTKCRLSDVTQRIIVGLATSVTPYYRQEGTVLLRNLNIKEGYLDDSELLYLDIDFAEKQTGKFINAGDVLTVHTGSNLGLSCVVPLKYENTLSFTTLITTPIKEKLLPEYLMYTINSGLGKSEIDKLKCGDIKPNLNVRHFKYFTIFLPPIDEQKQIVLYLEQKLSQIDNMICNKSKEIEKLQEYKKSLIYEVVTGKKEV